MNRAGSRLPARFFERHDMVLPVMLYAFRACRVKIICRIKRLPMGGDIGFDLLVPFRRVLIRPQENLGQVFAGERLHRLTRNILGDRKEVLCRLG